MPCHLLIFFYPNEQLKKRVYINYNILEYILLYHSIYSNI